MYVCLMPFSLNFGSIKGTQECFKGVSWISKGGPHGIPWAFSGHLKVFQRELIQFYRVCKFFSYRGSVIYKDSLEYKR